MNQGLRDIEILSIDAGSTDGTLEILEEYAVSDERIRIIHSDKRSYGYQVNLGIESAKGEYIGIVETDDIINPNMYERLYNIAISQNLPELAMQDYYLWAGIYQKDFIKDIRLSETPGATFQDTGFIYQVLSKADRAMYIADELYYYRQTKGNSSFNKNGFR
ncbi:MAG: glycosyltransferase [Lachnospiraceae bacterium]|nr:glycosyltransferase [Lachnospiraceae bacterium]